FATTVASGRATLATKRTLLLTWAGLPPAGSRQLCLAHSFDHLVCAGEQRRRHLDAERLRGLEIDDQLQLGWKLDRQIARCGALQDFVHVDGGTTKTVAQIDSITDQPAVYDMLTIPIDHWQSHCCCQSRNLLTLAKQHRGLQNDHRIGLL